MSSRGLTLATSGAITDFGPTMSDLRPRSATRLLNKFFKRFCSDEELWKRMYHNRWLQADDDAPSSKKKRQSWHLSYIMRHFVDRVRFPIRWRSLRTHLVICRIGAQTISVSPAPSLATRAPSTACNSTTRSS